MRLKIEKKCVSVCCLLTFELSNVKFEFSKNGRKKSWKKIGWKKIEYFLLESKKMYVFFLHFWMFFFRSEHFTLFPTFKTYIFFPTAFMHFLFPTFMISFFIWNCRFLHILALNPCYILQRVRMWVKLGIHGRNPENGQN